MTINGGCYCHNIQYEFSPGRGVGELSFRRCSCSYCSRMGAIYTSDPSGSIKINIKDPDKISIYHFATGVVDFVFCSRCGIMPYARVVTNDRPYAVINARTADIDLDVVSVSSLAIAEESPEEAMLRRARNWTPVVS